MKTLEELEKLSPRELDNEVCSAKACKRTIEKVIAYIAEQRQWAQQWPEIAWEDIVYEADPAIDQAAIELNELAMAPPKMDDVNSQETDSVVEVNLGIGEVL